MSRSSAGGWLDRRGRALGVVGPIGLLAVLPTLLVGFATWLSFDEGSLAIDFRPLRLAAEDFASGLNPWPTPAELPGLLESGTAYVYPPMAAFIAAPFALLPATPAALLWTALLVAATLGALRLLGVRDWRCYGAAFLWGCVVSAIQSGNVTLLLVAGVAALWRFRRNVAAAAVLAGGLIALKFFLWPLVVWLAATRRYRAAAGAAAVAVGLTLVTWAAIGFSGLADYPELLRALHRIEETRSYSVLALGLDLGLPHGVAWGAGLLVAAVVLAGAWRYSSQGDETRGLALAIAAAIAFSTVVWLHYFALLLVPVAIARPRYSALWLMPLAFWLGTGTGNGAPWQTAAILLAATGTLVLILRSAGPAPSEAGSRHSVSAAVTSRKVYGGA